MPSTRLKKYFEKGLLEVGCDEAGRGCLAGPVVAAAVVLEPRIRISGLNDSKKLSAKQRERLRLEIERKATHWAVGIVEPHEIDRINILNASFLAMHHALDQLTCDPDLLLIDGNRFRKYKHIRHTCVVKGDAKFRSIAAASILAKTYRDEIMEKLHLEFPKYDWCKNKGYPTIAHRTAVIAHGMTPHHRKSFRVRHPQLRLNL